MFDGCYASGSGPCLPVQAYSGCMFGPQVGLVLQVVLKYNWRVRSQRPNEGPRWDLERVTEESRC